MADISWSAVGLQFSLAEREAAIRGEGPTVNRAGDPIRRIGGEVLGLGSSADDLALAQALARATGGSGVQQGAGSVDPAQMQADGFVYVPGRGWVRADSPLVNSALVASATSTIASSNAQVIPGGSVLGYTVPLAPPVALPSFVGGRLGTVRIGGGLRPESGGRERVRMGPADLPVVRWS